MSDFEDDGVVVIDSSSSSSRTRSDRWSGSSAARGEGVRSHRGDSELEEESSWESEAGATTPRSEPPARPSTSTVPRTNTFDALRETVERDVRALPKLRCEADCQTSTTTLDAEADVLHRHVSQLEVALGLGALPSRPEVQRNFSSCGDALSRFAESWRERIQRCKRRRGWDGNEDEVEEPYRVKSVKTDEVSLDIGGVSPPMHGGVHDTPSWAVGLTAALSQCQTFLDSPRLSNAIREVVAHYTPLRKHLTESSVGAHDNTPQIEDWGTEKMNPSGCVTAIAQEATANAAVTASHAEDVQRSALLCEAELICSRENITTLQPLYAELHTLRRQRVTKERENAAAVTKDLKWEQRYLADILSECDAQLELHETDFINSCRLLSMPLDALQERMIKLHGFRRQLVDAATATIPMQPATAAEPPGGATAAKVMPPPPAPSRTTGLVSAALTHHMEMVRRASEEKMKIMETELQDERRRNADLQARYTHLNAQLQAAMDSNNYVDKGAIAAMKVQQRLDLEAVVGHLGWTLLNSTSDVLSLRHPRTGAVLHVNHTHSMVNGRSCDNVANTLASYLLQHSDGSTGTLSSSAVVVANEHVGLGENTVVATTAVGPTYPVERLSPPSAVTVSEEEGIERDGEESRSVQLETVRHADAPCISATPGEASVGDFAISSTERKAENEESAAATGDDGENDVCPREREAVESAKEGEKRLETDTFAAAKDDGSDKEEGEKDEAALEDYSNAQTDERLDSHEVADNPTVSSFTASNNPAAASWPACTTSDGQEPASASPSGYVPFFPVNDLCEDD